jgi:hypothetical protein
MYLLTSSTLKDRNVRLLFLVVTLGVEVSTVMVLLISMYLPNIFAARPI